MRDISFAYGGKHFVPVRKFGEADGDFYHAACRLRPDRELGFGQEDNCGGEGGKAGYSHKDFYAASTVKDCDIFRCVENGKLYVPCDYELQEYVEVTPKDRGREHER